MTHALAHRAGNDEQRANDDEERAEHVCTDCGEEFAVGDEIVDPRCPVCLGTRVRPRD
ncbi:hypothetical protein [Halorussus sp. AFM4]|uniref:hypothetical protein n=1 Tax=Halorussus sp. AFM4 TaxID=3421651 RepID=UPI003EBB310E